MANRLAALLPILAIALIGATPATAKTSPTPRADTGTLAIAMDAVPGTHVLLSTCPTRKPDGTMLSFPTEAECTLVNDCTSSCVTQYTIASECMFAHCYPIRPRFLIDVQAPRNAVVTTIGSGTEGFRWLGCFEADRDSHKFRPEVEAFREKLYANASLCLTTETRNFGGQRYITDFTEAQPFRIVTRPKASPFATSQLAFQKPRTFSTETIIGGHFTITALGMAAYDGLAMTCTQNGTSKRFVARTPLPFTLKRASNTTLKFNLWIGRLPSGTYFRCSTRLTSKSGVVAPAPLTFDVKTQGVAQTGSGNSAGGGSTGSSSGVSGIGPIGL